MFTLKNGVKIGVIGLTTYETAISSFGFNPPYSIKNISFFNYTDIVMRESRKLRENGADAVVLVSHLGD